LKGLIFALHDSDVEFIIGGGVVLVLHGIERITLDLDITELRNLIENTDA